MKRIVLLTTVMILGILLSSGVALAVTKVDNSTTTGSSSGNNSSDDLSPSESVQAATQGDPTNIKAEELTKTGDELESDQGEVEVSIPIDSSQDMTIDDKTGPMDVSIPGDANAVRVGKNVVYENTLPGVDVVAQAVEGGARQMYVLDSPEAKSSISFSAGNAGSSLVANPDGGISVLGAEGEEIATIGTPWAVDAEGEDLDTHYKIDGNTITQHVDTADAAFPVTADPDICRNRIRRVTFGQRGGRTTMFVLPTKCGRVVGALSGWREANREGGRRYRGSRERSLWKQYNCHFDVVPFKRTWNLEPWRPNVSWFRVYRSGCNPRR